MFSNLLSIMRASVLISLLLPGLVAAFWPVPGLTQFDRDFVFTDEEGHLVIRFAGTGGAPLDSSQQYEILNAEFSSMVHDHLHADLQFAAEARDPETATRLEPEITRHVSHAGPDFTNVIVECRTATCRVIMEQPGDWNDIERHRAVLGAVQGSLEAFIAARPGQFERVFMITAYYQMSEPSHIKAFLRHRE